MKNRVLYFPYIRIPRSTWLTLTLLYWDRVSSIVPMEFIERPELLGPYMQRLVQEELVLQVIPGMHIHKIPNFEGAFHDYINALGQDLAQRRAQFSSGRSSKIHIEKMGGIGQMLVDQELARPAVYPWYAVETHTANDFMSYLAAALGQVESVDSSPLTDKTAYLERFVRTGVAEDQLVQQLQSLRIQVLDKVLPVPTLRIDPAKIRTFKDRHAPLLGDFRRRVEREIIMAAAMTDCRLRQRQLDLFLDEAADRIEEIQAAMRDARWKPTRGGLSVLAAVPGVPKIFGLANALSNAFLGKQHQVPSQDFAYAAYARAKL
jgi:hypothetical protein